nr:hypothetical protein [Tanacetum cinerariifolium]
MDPNLSFKKICLEDDVIVISSNKVEGSGDWNSLEYQDTTGSKGKKVTNELSFYKMETDEVSERYIAPCFVNGLEAYDGEINLAFDENLISNEYAVKLCLDYEVKKRKKLECKANENTLADTGSDINTMPCRIYETLGREKMNKVDRGITMINHTKAEAMRILTSVLYQVGVMTIIAKFIILDIPIDRDAPILVRIVLNFIKSAESRANSTQESKPDQEARFFKNKYTMKLNFSKLQSLRIISAQRSKPNPPNANSKSPGAYCVNFPKFVRRTEVAKRSKFK